MPKFIQITVFLSKYLKSRTSRSYRENNPMNLNKNTPRTRKSNTHPGGNHKSRDRTMWRNSLRKEILRIAVSVQYANIFGYMKTFFKGIRNSRLA